MEERSVPAWLLIGLVATAALASTDEVGPIESLQGEIVLVDTAMSVVAVETTDDSGRRGRQITVKVDEETKIVKHGAPITLADLRKGDRVVVTYRTEPRARIAIAIGVQT
jgi:hypothetical protein